MLSILSQLLLKVLEELASERSGAFNSFPVAAKGVLIKLEPIDITQVFPAFNSFPVAAWSG
jgi:hypothetical protein